MRNKKEEKEYQRFCFRYPKLTEKEYKRFYDLSYLKMKDFLDALQQRSFVVQIKDFLDSLRCDQKEVNKIIAIAERSNKKKK